MLQYTNKKINIWKKRLIFNADYIYKIKVSSSKNVCSSVQKVEIKQQRNECSADLRRKIFEL